MRVHAGAMIVDRQNADSPVGVDILAKLGPHRRGGIDDIRVIATGEVFPRDADVRTDPGGLGKLVIVAKAPLVSGVIGSLVAARKEPVRRTGGERYA